MNNLLIGVVGSHAYGYANEDSDIDYMTVRVGELKNYFGITSMNDAVQNITKEEDETFYEFKKFMSLCAGFNPNVIPILFLDNYENQYKFEFSVSCWKFVHPVFFNILKNRNAFIGRKNARNTLLGYSNSMLIKKEKGVTGNLGEKRKSLIENFGYDVKAAAHAFRLLETGIFLFNHGVVNNKSGSDFCRSIRKGEISKNQFEELIEMKINEFENCHLNNRAEIPEHPNMELINELCVNTLVEYFQFWNK